ncbi:ATP-binding protein [Cupriavidus sp. AU9028]|uniref:ATP-binding protein n=1 Tax=Cupriavidus sp. AU9028 TaxID=2871157 RepID=UPI001C9792EC|nr:ATP-binding protein [Cupriavidus sp. AU9028]MBY4897644.1 sensor histidine kinase [Cupriavidus sp. AU9028]
MRPRTRALVAALALVGLGLALAVAVLEVVGRVALRSATEAVTARAEGAARFNVATLRRDLEKHRALPMVLAQDPDLRNALIGPDTAAVAALNRKLEELAAGTGASVIYLMNRDGLTLAASNWRGADTFVGENYAFRPYFARAAQAGAAEHFALGTISRRPGLYLSHRVADARGALLGVVAVKVEFDALEADWARLPDPVFVTSPGGVVLLSSEPAWRFRALRPVPPAIAARLRQSLQYGEATFETLPLRPPQGEGAPGQASVVRADVPARASDQRYVHIALPVASTDWTFHQLAPLQPEAAAAGARMQAQALVVLLLLYGAVATALALRQRVRRHNARQAAARAELTEQVRAATTELRAANDQLRAEMEERRLAELRLHAAQEQLVQASKLSSLGQIAAGVAHEINQPVAAIRASADNAGSHLARGNEEGVRTNLQRIGALTERIGAITGQLRSFARKGGSGAVEPISVDEAIEGALMLLGPRLQSQPVPVTRTGQRGAQAMGERRRLEQVLVNLLQNALDALAGQPDGRIGIAVEACGERVRIAVSDNGPGIAGEIAQRLFTPFSTSKPEGLGLGLVISRDIVRDFGGALDAAPAPGGGTVFTILLNGTRQRPQP